MGRDNNSAEHGTISVLVEDLGSRLHSLRMKVESLETDLYGSDSQSESGISVGEPLSKPSLEYQLREIHDNACKTDEVLASILDRL